MLPRRKTQFFASMIFNALFAQYESIKFVHWQAVYFSCTAELSKRIYRSMAINAQKYLSNGKNPVLVSRLLQITISMLMNMKYSLFVRSSSVATEVKLLWMLHQNQNPATCVIAGFFYVCNHSMIHLFGAALLDWQMRPCLMTAVFFVGIFRIN